ncbi:major facilitator superfamily domain-containing protein [Xylariales sp. PMI_506]|nr:major facilitator superfamily domain-containing protein [Xylariales sp. PMI_506]
MNSDTVVPRRGWKSVFSKRGVDYDVEADEKRSRPTWNMGMLNDKQTVEVPGSVLLLAKGRNEPLGLRSAPARTSHSSLPTGIPERLPLPEDDKKMTKDGQIILEPQPDDSSNDPLNWAAWRRDLALVSLGLHCMIGGGITPLIAAGFTNVANDYDIEVAEVSLTTGLYMMGLGIGSVIFSPTAILYGKRPVYLFSSILFILASVWCALSPNFTSLLLARIFQGVAVSPVECLPSATIAEIFFLHERAFRIGIYTLLLLGGKNLVPLVSAAIIQTLSWRWAFWVVAMVVGFSGVLLFFFVPETFWDRSPLPRSRHKHTRPSFFSRRSSRHVIHHTPTAENGDAVAADDAADLENPTDHGAVPPHHHIRQRDVHVGFKPSVATEGFVSMQPEHDNAAAATDPIPPHPPKSGSIATPPHTSSILSSLAPPTRKLRGIESPQTDTNLHDYFSGPADVDQIESAVIPSGIASPNPDSEKLSIHISHGQAYTHNLRQAPPKSFVQQLQIYHGRLNKDRWWKVALRPFILFAYPAILWSAAVYACSVGWLIVISESVAIIYRNGSYKFSALSTGLVYLSPFIGGIMGTAVAGRVSDVIVKAMARRNGGLYEPEFRLVMVAPIAVTTVIGLMGFGWSADVGDAWIVPTVFFGIVSFGCSLGSTTSITFCVDSYRQYAGEALVTLNFSKNIFHGLVFSLFVTDWLTVDGSKTVFFWIGIIQLILLLFTIPMYIFGKRMRMWTVRQNLVEKF